MTPPARPDPVAALRLAMKAALPGAFLQADDLALGSEAAGKALAEQGYVLVNADMLAEALDGLDVHWFEDAAHGAPEWNMAAAILAALGSRP